MRRVTRAFVLHQLPQGERDILVFLLSEDWGSLKAVAKGALRSKRRFVNVLEPFSLLRAHLRGGKVSLPPFLDQADLLEPYEKIRLDTKRYLYACYLAELLEPFLRPYTGKEYFPLFQQALEYLCEVQPHYAVFKMAFELKLLQRSGFAPSWDFCVRCERVPRPPLAFSWRDGGVVCPSCRSEEDHPLSGQAWAALRHLVHLPFSHLRRVKLAEVVEKECCFLLENFIKRLLDYEINTLRILKEMF